MTIVPAPRLPALPRAASYGRRVRPRHAAIRPPPAQLRDQVWARVRDDAAELCGPCVQALWAGDPCGGSATTVSPNSKGAPPPEATCNSHHVAGAAHKHHSAAGGAWVATGPWSWLPPAARRTASRRCTMRAMQAAHPRSSYNHMRSASCLRLRTGLTLPCTHAFRAAVLLSVPAERAGLACGPRGHGDCVPAGAGRNVTH